MTLFQKIKDEYTLGRKSASFDLKVFGRRASNSEWEIFNKDFVARCANPEANILYFERLSMAPDGLLQKVVYHFGRWREFNPSQCLYPI